jgi:predicted kinase
MAVFTMMVGVAGSGKSTIATQIAQKTGAEIVSSDAIRGEIYGDENCQANPAKVFEIVHSRVHKAIREQRDVIMDATNLSCKRRMAFLKAIAHFDCTKRCVLVIAAPEDIEERMEKRERKVPMQVVYRHIEQFQCPNFYEGWDEIDIKWTSYSLDCYKSFHKLMRKCHDMPHDNLHHHLDVDDHMYQAFVYAAADERGDSVRDGWVARIHDVGKGMTKTFVDRNGKLGKEAHYYNHQNVGAYYSLLHGGSDFDQCIEDALDDACIIQWHMEHYLRKGSALDKFYEMIGPELEKRLKVLEKADKAAH